MERQDVWRQRARFGEKGLALAPEKVTGDTEEYFEPAEWVIDIPKWTVEFECTWETFQYNEFSQPFWTWNASASNAEYRIEASLTYGLYFCRGGDQQQMIKKGTFVAGTTYKLAFVYDGTKIVNYADGVAKSTVVSPTENIGHVFWKMLFRSHSPGNAFCGYIRNFRFSSTVHTAEKIAADSKLDALPVEDDTVLYMPLKKDLSMYGHYND